VSSSLERLLEEARSRIRELVPDYRQLPVITSRLPGAEHGLEKWELNSVERGWNASGI